MIILGVCNFALISAVTVILGIFSPLSIIKSALYVLTPYITVNGLSLFILNKIRGADGVYISTAAALGVCVIGVPSFSGMFDARVVNALCIALCAVGTVTVIIQIRKKFNGKDIHDGIKN